MFDRLFRKLFLIIVSSLFIFSLNSIVVAFDSTNIKSDSVDLSWEAEKDVFIYKISYGNDSEKNISYDKNSDFIDKTNYTLYDLTPGTKYYLSLIGYDDLGNEKYKSDEISITTLGSGVSGVSNDNALFLEDSNLIGLNKVELSFSNEINDLSAEEREFKIENIADSNDVLIVLDTEVSKTNKKNLVLNLDKEPVIGQEYKVTVLNIRDIYNQNIEFGVDSEATFIGVEIEEKMLDLNSAEEESTNSGVLNNSSSGAIDKGNLSGVELSSADINSSVLSTAEKNSKLPQTGPEEILIFILAFILSAIIFIYRFRRV